MSSEITSGSFQTEEASVAAFQAAVGDRWFSCFTELPGSYIVARPWTVEKQPRLDLLLVPKREAVDAGWQYGCIGVEAKRSGVKIGPAVAQILDYQRAIFRTPGGFCVMPTYWALWPVARVVGGLDSILFQHRIMTADIAEMRHGVWLLFRLSGCNALRLSPESLRVKVPSGGDKRGSR